MIKEQVGNPELLTLPKTAFFCSRAIPAAAVLKCYDWAVLQREAGNCVISGFHSRIEKDVFHYLLKGRQPVIMALARGLKDRMEPEVKQAMDQGRLLVITPFEKHIKQPSKARAAVRNKMMIDLSDSITVGFISPGGQLETLLRQSGKPVTELVNMT